MFAVFIMLTISLTGNSSELSCDIFPSLEVDRRTQLCFLSLQTNNSIPNIDSGCNTIGFHSSTGKVTIITIPTGSYELQSLTSVIESLLPNDITSFRLKANGNTLKCLLKCSHVIDFTVENNISKLLGFKNEIYSANTLHESSNIVGITKVNCIKIDCNLISGSFDDGLPSQTIHEFFPVVPPGYKVIEVPKHLVFYPLNTSTISRVNITLKDQSGCLINLRGEPITVRLLIKNQ